jgi:hypothetical protein
MVGLAKFMCETSSFFHNNLNKERARARSFAVVIADRLGDRLLLRGGQSFRRNGAYVGGRVDLLVGECFIEPE